MPANESYISRRTNTPAWVVGNINDYLYAMRVRVAGENTRKYKMATRRMVKAFEYLVGNPSDDLIADVVLMNIFTKKFNLSEFNDYIIHNIILYPEIAGYREITYSSTGCRSIIIKSDE